MTVRCVVPTLLAFLLGSRLANGQLGDAQIWRITDTSRVVDLSIASSGGVSIGAYQAGASWMIAELLKFMRDHPEQRARFKLPLYRVSAISGASAGNVNALLMALQSCDAGPARPAESSALWDLWMQVGLDQLLPRNNGDPSLELGLLDRRFLNTVVKERLLAELAREPSSDCHIPIVTTMSKLVPSSLALNRLMAASVQRYVTSYSISTGADTTTGRTRFVLRSADRLVRLDTALGKQISLVTAGTDGQLHGIEHVFELMKASSSVAYLFAPVQLSFCDATATALAGTCEPGRANSAVVERARFVDGGAIDNAPLFAAIRLMEIGSSLERNGGENGTSHAGTLLVSYDARRPRPGTAQAASRGAPRALPNGECDPGPSGERCGGLGVLFQFLGGLMASGGQFELQWLARLRARDPSLRALDVDVTTRQSALAGEHFMNASAFLARPLREFDFHVGIYDALHFAVTAILCRDEHRLRSDSLGIDRCAIDTLRGLVDRFPLSCQSSLAVDLLLRREYRIDWSEALRETQLRSTSHCDDTSLESRERALAYRSIFDAVTSVAQGTAPPCPRAGSIVAGLCAEGTLHVLRVLRQDPFFYKYVRLQAEACSRRVAAAGPENAAQVSAQCFADAGFVRTLEDPEEAFFTLIRRLLDRAQWLEEDIEQRQDGPHSAVGWDFGTQVVNLGARSALLAEETGIVAFPTVVPQRRNVWRQFTGLVMPQEVALEALGNGWSFFWHPFAWRWQGGPMVSISTGVLRNGFAIAPDSQRLGGRKTRLTASARIGYRPILRGNPVLSSVTAGIRYVRPSNDDGDVSRSEVSLRHLAPELRFEFFWDRVALTVSRNPGYGAPNERRDLKVAVSLQDPGGILYWMLRSPSLR